MQIFDIKNISGQGFPDYAPPSYVTEALSDVANGDHLLNQYTRGFGHPRLVNALSKVYSQLTGRDIDPNNELIVTVGAYQSLYNSIYGHVDHGDEGNKLKYSRISNFS